MRHFRFSIAGLMGAVLVAAVGLAALLSASPIWAGAMVLLTYVVLGLAILCAVLRGPAERACWLGFCVFGMGYMAVMFAAADAAGVTSLPRRVETGFAIIDKDNVKDPAVARFIYQTPGK